MWQILINWPVSDNNLDICEDIENITRYVYVVCFAAP